MAVAAGPTEQDQRPAPGLQPFQIAVNYRGDGASQPFLAADRAFVHGPGTRGPVVDVVGWSQSHSTRLMI